MGMLTELKRENWINSERDRSPLVRIALCFHFIARDRPAISAGFGPFTTMIQFEIAPVRASCKRLDRAQADILIY